jgi:hypothetical protein
LTRDETATRIGGTHRGTGSAPICGRRRLLLVASPWAQAIPALAAALLRQGTLTGAEVNDVLLGHNTRNASAIT